MLHNLVHRNFFTIINVVFFSLFPPFLLFILAFWLLSTQYEFSFNKKHTKKHTQKNMATEFFYAAPCYKATMAKPVK